MGRSLEFIRFTLLSDSLHFSCEKIPLLLHYDSETVVFDHASKWSVSLYASLPRPRRQMRWSLIICWTWMRMKTLHMGELRTTRKNSGSWYRSFTHRIWRRRRFAGIGISIPKHWPDGCASNEKKARFPFVKWNSEMASTPENKESVDLPNGIKVIVPIGSSQELNNLLREATKCLD